MLFAGVAVADHPAAVTWYSRLFGRPPDIVPNEHEVMWRCTDSAWLYVIADSGRAGRALVTLCVPDLDQALAEITGRGVAAGPPQPVGDAGRKGVVTDPDGNTLAFIEVNQPEPEQGSR